MVDQRRVTGVHRATDGHDVAGGSRAPTSGVRDRDPCGYIAGAIGLATRAHAICRFAVWTGSSV